MGLFGRRGSQERGTPPAALPPEEPTLPPFDPATDPLLEEVIQEGARQAVEKTADNVSGLIDNVRIDQPPRKRGWFR